MKEKFKFTIALMLIVIMLGYAAFREYQEKQDMVFSDSLDKVVLTVDGEPLTLADLATYIAYEEQEMEKAARIYNPEDTDEYWNVYTNHTFLRSEGKQAVIDMAVHDEIFYRFAKKECVELSEEEEQYLANDIYDFWSDLEEEQRAALGISEEQLTRSMRKMMLAQKYQSLLATMKQKSMEVYDYNGQAYEKLLEDHRYVLDEDVWEKVPFGGITVEH